MGFEVLAYANRTRDLTGSLFQADGVTPFQLTQGDKLRFKLGRGSGGTPILDLVSSATVNTPGPATVNGSYVMISSLGVVGPPATSATYLVRIAQGDTAGLTPGPYDAEVLQIDSNAANASRELATGIVHVVGDLAGTLGP